MPKTERLGLDDVLYDPKTRQIYTPNTNAVVKMGEAVTQINDELRYNENHDEKGRFTFGSSGSGSSKKSVDKSGKSGIIESEEVKGLEQSKKRDHKVYITDTAIDKVDRVKPSDFSDYQADKMHQMHKELLRVSKEQNNSNEVLIISGLDFSAEITIKGSEFEVTPAKNPFAVSVVAHAEKHSLVYLHNHPSTNTFSVGDIDTFCCDRAIKTMSVVTNQGEVYVLNKTGKYSFDKTKAILTNIHDSFPNGDIDDKEFVGKYFKQCHEGGVEYVKAK